MFEEERTEYQRLSAANPTCTHKSAIVRELMANEAARYPGCTDDFLVALALTYRHIMLDQAADPRDKVEILRRVYSTREPEWMTAEIVYLHFVLLDQCRYLARPSASIERKEETLRWIFTDPELEDRPFYDHSKHRYWSFAAQQIWNDHLDEDGPTGPKRPTADHGIVCARFAWDPAAP